MRTAVVHVRLRGERSMRIRALKLKRVVFATGALAAGLLAGCQVPGSQFAHPGVARGDMGAGSPAFAQLQTGQPMANTTAMAGGRMMVPMNSGMPMMTAGM